MAGNRRVVLKAGPVGKVRASDLSIEEAPVPSPGDGQMLGERLSGGALAFERGNARRLRGGHLGGKVILAGGGFELYPAPVKPSAARKCAIRAG